MFSFYHLDYWIDELLGTWVIRNVVRIVHKSKFWCGLIISICRTTNGVDIIKGYNSSGNIINFNRGLQNNCMPIITKAYKTDFYFITYEFSNKIKYFVPSNGGFWSSSHHYIVCMGLAGSCWCQRTLSLQQLAVYQIRHKVKKESSWALLLFS